MKRLLAALSLATLPAAAAPTAHETLVIVATTDQHGHVEAQHEKAELGGHTVELERGGAALLGGYLANLRAHYGERVLLLDAGDMLQGTMVSNLGEGRVMVRAMNQLGYAAAAVGNHEFDFGPVGAHAAAAAGEDPRGVLKARAAEATFPWLTANLVDGKGLPPGAPYVRRYVVVDAGGVKVGVVGGTSEDTPRTTIKPNVADLRVLPLADAIQKGAADARKAGADVVLALVHAGGECRDLEHHDDLSTCAADSEVFQLARALSAEANGGHAVVDAILAGHTHQGLAQRVAGIPVVQAFSNLLSVSRIDLDLVRNRRGKGVTVNQQGTVIHSPEELCAEVADESRSCRPGHLVGRKLVPATYEDRPVVADAKVTAAIAEDVAVAAQRRAEPVGVRLDGGLRRAYKAESPLGNLVADALRTAAKSDVGMTNGGGLRADLPAGDLRYGVLFEALPFDNRLALMRLHGKTLRHLVAVNLRSDKGILSFAGLHVTARCTAGRLEVELALDGGRPVDDAALYTLATSDFLALGGDDFADIARDLREPGALVIDDTGPTLRDVVAADLKARGTVHADDKRLFDPDHPRVVMPSARPVRCAADTAPPVGGGAPGPH